MFRSIDLSLRFWLLNSYITFYSSALENVEGNHLLESVTMHTRALTHPENKNPHHQHQNPVLQTKWQHHQYSHWNGQGLSGSVVSLPSSPLEGFKALHCPFWGMVKFSLMQHVLFSSSFSIWDSSALTNRNKNVITQRKHTSQLTTSGRPSCSQ